ncbi:MAG: glycosyltransferase family 2 protein [Pyrinomonadaceae bacterium]
MDTAKTKVALVMPVHNRREITLQGIRSLDAMNSDGLDVRIYVVDDGSTDGTADAVEQTFPNVVLIRADGTLHYAAGTNCGIEHALEWEPEFVATMNDDAVFHPDFLKWLIHTARENERSIIGSLLLLWDEPHRVFQVGQTWDTLSGGWIIPNDVTIFNVSQEPFDVECIVGNCVLFPVEAIRECGLMDEKRFPHGWGDAQWLMRMRKSGWRLMVDPRSRVWCEPNNYPDALHTMPAREKLKALFVNERHPLNLKRQFVARWDSAPTHAEAAAAFAVYLGSLVGKAFDYGFKRRAHGPS